MAKRSSKNRATAAEVAAKIASLKDEVLAERRLREEAESRLAAQRHITETHRDRAEYEIANNQGLMKQRDALAFALILAHRNANELQGKIDRDKR